MQKYEPHGLGWMDALIAATARQSGLPLLTRDAKLAKVLAGEAQFEIYTGN
jgi:predicted nucleic acid-binding protein